MPDVAAAQVGILCLAVKVAPGTDDRYYACWILERRFEARRTSGELRLAGSGGGSRVLMPEVSRELGSGIVGAG